MTLHFSLKLNRPIQGEFPIVCRITNNRQKTEFQIPFLTCPENCWDKASESALPCAPMQLEINRQVQYYKSTAAEIQYEYGKAGRQITIILLKNYLLVEKTLTTDSIRRCNLTPTPSNLITSPHPQFY